MTFKLSGFHRRGDEWFAIMEYEVEGATVTISYVRPATVAEVTAQDWRLSEHTARRCNVARPDW